MEKLTICSVSYNSSAFLIENFDLVQRLNPGQQISWIVAENSPSGSQKKLFDDHFRVIEGTKPVEPTMHAYASYHHAGSLNKTLSLIDTRFVLFVDPDFFILKKNWLNVVTDHMKQNNLSFFGVPWHPKWINKYRGFPCVHCLFVDLRKVNIKELDFVPEYHLKSGKRKYIQYEGESAFVRHYRNFLIKLLRGISVIRKLSKIKIRSTISSSPDTGSGIYRKFYNRHEFEMAIPVVTEKEYSNLDLMLDYLLPDNLRFVSHKNKFTRNSMKDFGLLDYDSMGCEEFLWLGEPFGFHVRNYPKILKGKQGYDQILNRIFKSLEKI